MTNKHHSNPLKSWLARHHPSGFLLAAQLIQLVLYASFDDPSNQWELLSATGALILVLVIWVVSRSPALDWIAWFLAIPAFFLSIFSVILENPSLIVCSSVLEAILYFYAAGSMIVYMLNDTSVTTDELFAAGATFTLLAWGFAYSYLVCQALVPDSFINGAHPGQPLTFIELLFLSFTNLSATGLGDILPVSAPARVIAMLEQFSGVGYIAIVVSRLIGLTTNFQKKRKK
jgi:hypothetical protein